MGTQTLASPAESSSFYTLIAEWEDAKSQVEESSAKELRLRNELIASGFDPAKVEGSESIKLGNGWILKSVKKLYYSVNKGDDLDAFEQFCHKAQLDEVPKSLLRWKPEVNVSTYKDALPMLTSQMPGSIRSEFTKLLANLITVKPGQASLELVAPKDKTK